MWRLSNICVDPNFQRRGIGALLIQWGKEQAAREECPIGLSASEQGESLYLSEGFRLYGTIRIEGCPIENIPVFLWEPPGMEGKYWAASEMKTQALA